MNTNDAWLIFYKPKSLWWRPIRRGYTTSILDAGVYSEEQAFAQEKARPGDFAVRLPSAIGLSFSCEGTVLEVMQNDNYSAKAEFHVVVPGAWQRRDCTDAGERTSLGLPTRVYERDFADEHWTELPGPSWADNHRSVYIDHPIYPDCWEIDPTMFDECTAEDADL